MSFIEITAKTVDDAIIEAMKELKISYEELEVDIIEQGSKGFLGFGTRNAVIQVKTKFEADKIAVDFLREILDSMGLESEIKATIKDEKHLLLVVEGEDMGILIGKRGQTLDAIQYLINLVVNKGNASYISITLDTENYRARRKETLERLARNLAKKVKSTKRKVVLEPMNPYERRIIHSTLQNDRQVQTYSEGEEPYRNIVIVLK